MTRSAIALQTSDGEVIFVDRSVLRPSETIHVMLQDLGMDEAGNVVEVSLDPIPLHPVDAKTLRKILAWCEHHKDDADIDKEPTNDKTLSEWDAEYLNMEPKELVQLVNAANYLDIKLLLNQLAIKVAAMIDSKSVEDVREMFDITNDFTKEEEEQIKKENEWCELK
ncbi:hypothetical protein AB6A40_007535 [Gnathostoma spinigerum]|uniref:Skp1-related protein n=1 Tax=Gnathostoma spinigerum TaxID=75299 RepID=A0ABD6EM15_9BILA